MDKIHDITEVVISNGVLKIKVDGKIIRRPLKKISQRLAQASDVELNMFTISPSGYGIHWPLIDEDISADYFRVICPECETEGTNEDFHVRDQWEI